MALLRYELAAELADLSLRQHDLFLDISLNVLEHALLNLSQAVELKDQILNRLLNFREGVENSNVQLLDGSNALLKLVPLGQQLSADIHFILRHKLRYDLLARNQHCNTHLVG